MGSPTEEDSCPNFAKNELEYHQERLLNYGKYVLNNLLL